MGDEQNGNGSGELQQLQRRVAVLEAALSASEQQGQQLRQIIDLVPDYIFATDTEGRFLLVNQRLAAAYGRPPEEVCGRLESELSPSHSQSRQLLADNAEVLRSGSPKFVAEQLVHDAHGRRLTVQIHRIPYRDAASGAQAVLGLATDISERKRIELALREKARIEHDLSLAREIQRGLLPCAIPEIAGFAIAGWNESAEETGGDYFDWLGLPDGRTLFSMGDVSGHGLGSAMLVALCRAYLRASARHSGSLEEAIERVNELLSHDLPEDRFITLVAGLLDPERRELTLFSAGHGPIFFYRAATDEVLSWPADDLPLGLARVDICRARTLAMASGDLLVLVTDGFFEWDNGEGERYGIERLKVALRERRGLEPAALIDSLYRDVLTFGSAVDQADDLTALVLKCL